MSKTGKTGRARTKAAKTAGRSARGLDRRLMGRPGVATPQDIEKALAALPDVAEEGEWVDVPQDAEAAPDASDAPDAAAPPVPQSETPPTP